MKVITLLPVKNEAWILRSTLKNMSDFSDHIIIADQNSNDGSIEIYKEFKKVIVIENKNNSHNNSVRWQLLDFAREQFGTGNIIICIDADEMLSTDAISLVQHSVAKEKLSTSFSFPWIQLWGNTEHFRNDTVWKNNYKEIIFFDDGKIDYERKTVLNDHTSRIPNCERKIQINQFPLIHYQYVLLKQAEIKQAWYRCSELLSRNTPKRINHKYSVAANGPGVSVEPIHQEWLKGLPPVTMSYDIESDWRYRQILEWFSQHGIAFFEPLDIWNIKELRDRFLSSEHREPNVETYPLWLIALNSIKNKLKFK